MRNLENEMVSADGFRPRRIASSIQGRLFLLLVAMLIPVLLIEAFIYYDRFRSERSHELQANLDMAKAVSQMFDGFIQDVLHQEVAIGIALSPPKPLSPERAQEVLLESRAEYPALLEISWVGPQGVVAMSTFRDAIGVDISDRKYMQEIFAGKEWFVSNLLTARVSHQPVFTISQGIRARDGSLLGVVVAVAVPDRLGKIFLFDRIVGGEFSIVDHQGMLVYHYPGHEFSSKHQDWLKNYPIIEQALKGKTITATTIADDLDRKQLVSFAPIPSIGWVAGYSRPENEALSTITNNLITQGTLFGLVTIAAFLTALVASRGIVIPIRKLRESAASFGQGQLNHRVEIEGPSELRDLGNAFNQMTEEIFSREQERQNFLNQLESYAQELRAANARLQSQADELTAQKQELHRAHAELEQRVSARTDELARANESLQKEIGERTKAQQAVVKQKELLETIFSTVHFSVAYMDEHFNFIRVNTAYAEAEREPPDFFVGKNHFDLYPNEENEKIFRKVVETGRPYFVYEKPFAYEHRPERGITYWDWSLHPVRDVEGAVSGVILCLIDRTESAHARESLRKSEKQLRVLSSKLLSAHEEERKRFARDLHDSVGSSLTAVKLNLEGAVDLMSQNRLSLESVQSLITVVQGAIDEARRMINDLRPPMLDDLGLVSTINWFCKQFGTVYPAIHIEQQLSIEEGSIPDELKIAIFRIVQEALNNIAKYSKAKLVQLRLLNLQHSVQLSIKDNGTGFDLHEVRKRNGYKGGLGLASMKERAELLGGRFTIASTIGKGTFIQADWPLQ